MHPPARGSPVAVLDAALPSRISPRDRASRASDHARAALEAPCVLHDDLIRLFVQRIEMAGAKGDADAFPAFRAAFLIELYVAFLIVL